MGVYTRKKDNKVFSTLDGKEVWVCDRCEVAFMGSDEFFNHLCDKGEVIYPQSKKPIRYVLNFKDLSQIDRTSEVQLVGDEKELIVYLRNWANSIEESIKKKEGSSGDSNK